MKTYLQYLFAAVLALASGLALATDPTVDYAALATAAIAEVVLAVAGGVLLFGAVFGIKVGIRVLKSFASV